MKVCCHLINFHINTVDPPPPNTAWQKNSGIGKMAVKGVILYIFTKKKHIRDMKISAGIGGEAVNGGAVLGGGGRLYKSIEAEWEFGGLT